MPPAITDDEASDVEIDAPASSTAKKAGREKRQSSYKEEAPEVDGMLENGDVDELDEDDDEDGEEPEDVYVVEKITGHTIKKGEPLYHVKWEGYDDPKDMTWEPEENLADASEILKEYLEGIGGREKLSEQTQAALKTKKRGRPSSSAASIAKRSKKNGDVDSDTSSLAVRPALWKPPSGSWEDHIAQLDACEDEESGKLMVYLTWKNGHKTQHDTAVIYQRCPQKMLQFYERHVRIIKRDVDDAESIGSGLKGE